MIIEFAGIPGSGKSLLATRLKQKLADAGYPSDWLRTAASSALEARQGSIRFLINRPDRNGIYGIGLMAQQAPAMMAHLLGAQGQPDARTDKRALKTLIRNLEMMAQSGIVARYVAPDQIILNDEGFLQRITAHFFSSGDLAGFEDCLADVPAAVTVYVRLPAAESLRRIRGRQKGVPLLFRSTDDATILAQFEAFDALLERGGTALENRGMTVLRLDGQQSPDDLLERLWHDIAPLVQKPA